MRNRQPTVLIRATSLEALRDLTPSLTEPRPTARRHRTRDWEERWVLRKLLETSHIGAQRFPLKLVHRDRPDFLLECASATIGIEVSEVVPENLAKARRAFDELDEVGTYFPDSFRLASARMSRKKVVATLLSESHGRGYVGDAVEREAALHLAEAVEAKTKSFRGEGFERFERNLLLLYYNGPLAPKLSLLAPITQRLFPQVTSPEQEVLIRLSSKWTSLSHLRSGGKDPLPSPISL